MDWLDKKIKTKYVLGIDEVGRGAGAGPFVVASCLIPVKDIGLIDGINDSKKLSDKKRRALYNKVTPYVKHLAIFPNNHVDERGINTLFLAALQRMKLNSIDVSDVSMLVDGIVSIDGITSIIKGDSLCYSIACASIFAKVWRDDFMTTIAGKYPQYGFEKHKGYLTKQHIEAIKKLGICDIHRKSFLTKILKG